MSYTLRQTLQRVLTNIGEPTSAANVPAVGTAITDTYQLQICNFINHIKQEIEQAHQWNNRWQTFTMSYVTYNTTQRIYDSGGYFLPAGAYPYSGCQVVRQHNPKMGREVALVFDITTFGIPFVLDEMPLADITYYNTVLNQTPVAYSTNFCLQDTGNDFVNLIMYPGANSTRNIQMTLYNPQKYIDPTNGTGNQIDIWNTGEQALSFNTQLAVGATTGTLTFPFPFSSGTYTVNMTGSASQAGQIGVVTQTFTATFTQNTTAVTAFSAPIAYSTLSPTFLCTGFLSNGIGCDSLIMVPSRVLEIGASWWALEERGEELGTSSMFTEDRYRRALDDEIGKDQSAQGDLMMIVA